LELINGAKPVFPETATNFKEAILSLGDRCPRPVHSIPGWSDVRLECPIQGPIGVKSTLNLDLVDARLITEREREHNSLKWNAQTISYLCHSLV